MNMPLRKNILSMPQGPPNPGFMQEKVQKGDFLKKPLRELKLFFVLGSYESLEVGCPKNSKHLIFDPTRTFRIFRILDLEKSQGMKGLSDPI